ncbi:MAG TPA: metalloregulator ArsR/SmtB family transcription factor [Actinomycetota bacterium]|nr:metalloregulator ArsR/SmtB family transcription factor [Actinomycetota bacterium]
MATIGVEPGVCRALDSPISRDDAERLASAVKVLADPARLQILSILKTLPGAAACAGEFVRPLRLSASTVSHHLKVLHEAGLIDRERHGPWIYYRFPPERLNELCRAIL